MKVLFFAQLRERLNRDETEIDISLPTTVADIRSALLEKFPEQAEILQDGKSLVAINQELINDERSPVSENDEIAFFPPVTGG
jgi:molybdopterin synthase sulfur carrier subunit